MSVSEGWSFVIDFKAYEKIDDQGLHIVQEGQARILEIDHVVVCAGQIFLTLLADLLETCLKILETAREQPFGKLMGALEFGKTYFPAIVAAFNIIHLLYLTMK